MTDTVVDGGASLSSRPERLRRSVDVQRALRRGRSRGGDLLAVHVVERPDEAPSPARLTVVASRRVGGAVRRNRAKRLLREAARAMTWPAGRDVVLVARAACADSDVLHVRDEMDRLAQRLDLPLDAAVQGDHVDGSAASSGGAR